MNIPNRSSEITISLILSILSFIVSLSTFAYSIYKDNKEAISLWCFEYHCVSNGDNGYSVSGTYIVNNNSHKNVSVIDAYITYDGIRIPSDISDNFPITLNPGESYKISISPQYVSYYFKAQLFELHVISSAQKHYSVESKYY